MSTAARFLVASLPLFDWYVHNLKRRKLHPLDLHRAWTNPNQMIVMVGAAQTHLRRGENRTIVANAILFGLAAFVAYGRFIAEPLA